MIDKSLLQAAFSWRKEQGLSLDINQSLRLFADASDGFEGLLIDKFGPFILLTLYRYMDEAPMVAKKLLADMEDLFPEHALLVKARARHQSNEYSIFTNSLYQAQNTYLGAEEDRVFEIHCDPRHDFGLYLDTKAARQFIFDQVKDCRVLNLFSYTCAFAVAAMKGGAKEVVNIDPCKEYLDWGGRNADHNQVVFKRYQDTTQDYLARHFRRLEKGTDESYDWVIVDPPAFLVGRGDERLARKMWPSWWDQLDAIKATNYLIIINDKDLGREKDLEQFIKDGLRNNCQLKRIPQSLDVIGRNPYQAGSHYFVPEVFMASRR